MKLDRHLLIDSIVHDDIQNNITDTVITIVLVKYVMRLIVHIGAPSVTANCL
ncbi:unnamed protein product [Schistosoma curassoni]|uniref:Uncharacterized protein n=1 Tax=Schistosoma curassoni TaxID=6186 RepID=A0A183KCT3_9TREM|nr:unnamed protein product [Schistosoma curassoni]